MKEKLRVVGRYSWQHRQEINNGTKSCSQRNILWSAWTYILARCKQRGLVNALAKTSSDRLWYRYDTSTMLKKQKCHQVHETYSYSSGNFERTTDLLSVSCLTWTTEVWSYLIHQGRNRMSIGLFLNMWFQYACGHNEGSVKSMRIPAPITIWKPSGNGLRTSVCSPVAFKQIGWRYFEEVSLKNLLSTQVLFYSTCDRGDR